MFEAGNVPDIAIEVHSVRIVAPNLAVEDGIVHLTPIGEVNAPPRSTSYTTVLQKNSANKWLIASTRSLQNVTDASGRLAELGKLLNGEWTATNSEGIRIDLAIGWAASGKYLSGAILTTTGDSEPQHGSIRIAWNAVNQTITSWLFEAGGGVSEGIWTPTKEGWMVRTEGATADGESTSATQEFKLDGPNTLIWSLSNVIVDGERVQNSSLRLVRPAPAPTSSNE